MKTVGKRVCFYSTDVEFDNEKTVTLAFRFQDPYAAIAFYDGLAKAMERDEVVMTFHGGVKPEHTKPRQEKMRRRWRMPRLNLPLQWRITLWACLSALIAMIWRYCYTLPPFPGK